MEWPSGEPSSWVAGALAGIATFFVGLWKGRLKMRADLRDDQGEAVRHTAHVEIVTNLREEVERMALSVSILSDENRKLQVALRASEDRAYLAERKVAELTERVQSLEMSIQTTR